MPLSLPSINVANGLQGLVGNQPLSATSLLPNLSIPPIGGVSSLSAALPGSAGAQSLSSVGGGLLESQSSGRVYGTTDEDLAKNPNYSITFIQYDDAGNPAITVKAFAPTSFQASFDSQFQAPFAGGLLGGGFLGNLAAALTGTRLTAQALTMQVWQGGADHQFTVDLDLTAWSNSDDVRGPLAGLIEMGVAGVDNGLFVAPGPRLDPEETGKILAGLFTQTASVASQVISASNPPTSSSQANTSGSSVNAIASAANDQATVAGNSQSIASALTNNGAVAQEKKIIGQSSTDLMKKAVKKKISVQIGQWFTLPNIVITNLTPVFASNILDSNGFPIKTSVQVTFIPFFQLSKEDVLNMFVNTNSSPGVGVANTAATLSLATGLTGGVKGIIPTSTVSSGLSLLG